MKKISLFLCALSLLFMASCGTSTNDATEVADSTNEAKAPDEHPTTGTMAVAEDDAKFVVEAANGGMAEVELGNLAQQKGTAAAVKDFGKMMVTDHSKANEELKSLAAAKSITLPAALGEDQQKVVNDLSQKPAKDFDKAYIDAMVEDHKKDIDLFENAGKNLKDPELKAFVDKTLPTLKMHLEHCQSVKDKMK